jgi:hypothetical protein
MAIDVSNPSPRGDFDIEFSLNGSEWTALCAVAVSVSGLEQRRELAQGYTACGGVVMALGKRHPIDITVRMVYTEAPDAGFHEARLAHEGNGKLYLRYKLRASQGDAKRYVTANGDGTLAAPGLITAFQYPESEAGSGRLFVAGLTLRTANLLRDT